jgi:hypothetical protein
MNLDIEKLKYDLAMQCALVEVIKLNQDHNDLDIRSTMLEHFESNYLEFSMMDKDHFENLLQAMSDTKKFSLNPMESLFMSKR